MIQGITFLKCLIYFRHLVASAVSQNLLIPSTNSALFFFGFTSLLMNSFSSCQRFSIGLASGNSGGIRQFWWRPLPIDIIGDKESLDQSRGVFVVVVLHITVIRAKTINEGKKSFLKDSEKYTRLFFPSCLFQPKRAL